MEASLDKLKCGECSEEKHLLYIRQNGEIIAECIKCKSTSEIVTTKPRVVINHLNGDGTLCVF